MPLPIHMCECGHSVYFHDKFFDCNKCDCKVFHRGRFRVVECIHCKERFISIHGHYCPLCRKKQ